MSILFYGASKKWGEFSNFYPAEIKDHFGTIWPTSEAYFQGTKFIGSDPEWAEQIRLHKSPYDSAKMGRNRAHPINPKWELIKDGTMYQACTFKFEQHPKLKAVLLSTGDQKLIENAPGDYYWGVGKDGSDKNQLGITLMNIRTLLRKTGLK